MLLSDTVHFDIRQAEAHVERVSLEAGDRSNSKSTKKCFKTKNHSRNECTTNAYTWYDKVRAEPKIDRSTSWPAKNATTVATCHTTATIVGTICEDNPATG